MKKKQGLAQPCTDGHPQEIGASEDHESPQSTDAGSAWPKRLKSTDAASAWPKRQEIDWFPDRQRALQKEQSQYSHNSIRSIDKKVVKNPTTVKLKEKSHQEDDPRAHPDDGRNSKPPAVWQILPTAMVSRGTM